MKSYKLSRAGQEAGPYTLEQLQAGLQQGSFLGTDWAWCEGMTTWTPLSQVMAQTPPPAALTQPAPKPVPAPAPTPVPTPTPAAAAEVNPYKAPESNVIGPASGKVPIATVSELSGTRPWVRLISALMRIAAALFVISAVGIIASVSMASRAGDLSSVIFIVVFLGITAVLIVYPTLKLSKYSANISRLVESHSFADLNDALAEQRRFWKFYGIIALIYIILVVGGVVLELLGAGIGYPR